MMKLWITSSGECIRNFEKWINGFVYFSPDGSKVLVDANQNIELLNFSTGDCIYVFKSHAGSQINSYCFSADGMKIVSTSLNSIFVYHLDYDLTFPGWHDWDEGARPYLDIFLTIHPNWTDEDFNNILIPDLQNRGYGWLRPEGVRAELEKMNAGSIGQTVKIQSDMASPRQENAVQETVPHTLTEQPDNKTSFWKRMFGK